VEGEEREERTWIGRREWECKKVREVVIYAGFLNEEL